MKKFKKIAIVLLAAVMLGMSFATLAACNKTKLDNENTRLVLSIGELDGVFNPFFSSSATDGSIISMTQVSMLSSDKDGNVAFGADEPCVVLDYSEDVSKPNPDDKETWSTTYKFVLKNNLKFSNGSPLTMKDVLFNLYVYLDPAYTGSSTVYSTDIKGLAEYRTQQPDTSGQEHFNEQFVNKAQDRIIEKFVGTINQLFKKDFKNKTVTDAEMRAALQEEQNKYHDWDEEGPDDYSAYFHLVEDYDYVKELFLEQLNSDYNAAGDPADITFDNGRMHLDTPADAFFYTEGLINWDNENKRIDFGAVVDHRHDSKEQAVQLVYDMYVAKQTATNNVGAVAAGSTVTQRLLDEFTAKAMKEYFDESGISYTNVSGITFPNKDDGSSVVVNGKTYGKPTYASDGTVTDGNEVLQIEINGVDPKAIWNFAFTVAPMYYYSDPDYYKDFNFVDNFGVKFSDIDFMNDFVKNPDRIGLPMGAGPYKATTVDGKGTPTPDTFRANNVVHYERNEYFMLGPAKIKYVNYQVVTANMMLDSLFNGDIHFAEPNCKQASIDRVDGRRGDGFTYKNVLTNGYGYIGINAEKVPSLEIRQAIMHAINTQDCLDYYGIYAQAINRSMSRASWAYPDGPASEGGTDDEGQYYKFDPTGDTIDKLVAEAQYYPTTAGEAYSNSNSGDKLEYTFTIAGDSEDHPAYNAMFRAAEILNEHGFKIEVKKDINALKKLNTGDLTVWAAAWGGGVDPDMYQVYHRDSMAGATANWGYRAIRLNAGNKYYREVATVEELSQKIDEAREVLEPKARKPIYKECLDLVMQLAVELPTYQRMDMYAYNKNILDESTMTPQADLTPFNGLLNRLWEVSFVNG